MALKSVPRFFRKTAGGHFVGPIFIRMGGTQVHQGSFAVMGQLKKARIDKNDK